MIYLDNAATTYPKPERVYNAVLDCMKNYCANPGRAGHKLAMRAAREIYDTRENIAKLFNVSNPMNIVFTSNATDSLNLAIKGVLQEGDHVITTSMEHNSVIRPIKALEKRGIENTVVKCDYEGFLDYEDLEKSIKSNTKLIVTTHASNVCGTLIDIKKVGEIAKKHNIVFHTDAVQAAGNINIDVKELNINLMSMSSHKIYGPKGVGALYIKTGTKLHSLSHGGAQERKRRGGTENMPAIVGYGKAAEIAKANMDNHIETITKLRNKLINGILDKIPYSVVNGSLEDRLPGNANIRFEFIEGESIILMLDMLGIAVSTGSACASGSLDPSHVLMAIGLLHEEAHGSIRFSIGDFTTEEDIDYIIENLPPVIERLRSMSPLYDQKMKQK